MRYTKKWLFCLYLISSCSAVWALVPSVAAADQAPPVPWAIESKSKPDGKVKQIDIGLTGSLTFLYQNIPSLDGSVNATLAGPQLFFSYRFKPFATLVAKLAYQKLLSKSFKGKSLDNQVTQTFYPLDILVYYTKGSKLFNYGVGAGFTLFSAGSRKVRGTAEDNSTYTDILFDVSVFIKKRIAYKVNGIFSYTLKLNLTPSSNVSITDLLEIHNSFDLGASYSLYDI